MKRSFNKSELLLTLPSLLFLTVFFLIPAVILIACAFKERGLYGGFGAGWSLDAIFSLFSQGNFIVLIRTVLLSSIATSLTLLLAIPAAYGIARSTPFLRRLLLILIIVPSWSSFLIRVYAWKLFLHPEGPLKHFLETFFFVSPETILLYNDGAVLLVMIYTYLPFAILPIYTASLKFNQHLFEAALDLGCTRLQAFFKVFLPGISRGISTAILLVFIPFMGAYVIPDLVGGTHSEMLGNRIAQKTLVERDFPEAASLSLLLAIATIIPLYFFSRVEKRGFDLKVQRNVE
jgi:spermidine/putrescine transport system permease protein